MGTRATQQCDHCSRVSDCVHQDPQRLLVAAHELGHAVAWSQAGLLIRKIRVIGHGHRTEGDVIVRREALTDMRMTRAYLVGLLAGKEASNQWCRAVGRSRDESGCREDQRSYQKIIRHQVVRAYRFRDGDLRHEAQQLIRTHWNQINKLTPQLAACGNLNPATL